MAGRLRYMGEVDLIDNLKKVEKNIEEAALRSGRKRDDITLLAVSKNHSLDDLKILRKAGVKIFGENLVQELQEKDEKLKSEGIIQDWHFIGHLQRNKVKYLMRMENCRMIESIDSLRLAKEVNKRASKNNRIIPVLIEINAAGDENKYGIKAEHSEEFLKKLLNLKYLDIKGLMTVLPYLDNPEDLRPYFKKMKKLFDSLSKNTIKLDELSIGMTNDYQIAIEEGATIVRVGTALFGKREY
jgi:hypothetical protein